MAPSVSEPSSSITATEPVIAAPALPLPPSETVWVEHKLPEGATAIGTWIWDSSQLPDGALSHGHLAANGLQYHGYTPEKPLAVPSNGMILQDVWLDPNDPPKGIAVQVKLASGEDVGVYWEGEEEVFKPAEGQELWYYGVLPEFGRWTKLEILAEDMGLEDAQVTEVRFVTFGGRAFWNRTVLTEAPPIEEVQDLLEGPPQIRPSQKTGS